MIRRLTQQYDVEEIADVMRGPDMWDSITDDSSVFNLDHLSALIRIPSVYFLVPVINGVRVGIFFFHPHNSITFEIHSMVKQENRGELTCMGVVEAGIWMFDNTKCLKIVTQVPEGNIRAKYLARRMGMTMEGVNRKSLMKNGKLLDQTWYGVCKGDPAVTKFYKKEETCQHG